MKWLASCIKPSSSAALSSGCRQAYAKRNVTVKTRLVTDTGILRNKAAISFSLTKQNAGAALTGN